MLVKWHAFSHLDCKKHWPILTPCSSMTLGPNVGTCAMWRTGWRCSRAYPSLPLIPCNELPWHIWLCQWITPKFTGQSSFSFIFPINVAVWGVCIHTYFSDTHMPYREVSRAWDFTEYEWTELGIPASKHGDIGVICGDAARFLFGFLGWISCQLHRVWTAGCQGLCSYIKCRCNCRVRQKLYEIVTSRNYRRGCWRLVCPSGMSAADFSWKNSRFQGLSRG
jgi:hypothetical protein